MSLNLDHSPADIIRWLLVALGLGTSPNTSPLGSWPAYMGKEPNVPDNCITVYNSQGREGGRIQNSGERIEFHGFMVRVRATTEATGYAKCREIAEALDTEVYHETVTISGASYRVGAVTRTSDVLPVGTDRVSERLVFTVNGVVNIRRL